MNICGLNFISQNIKTKPNVGHIPFCGVKNNNITDTFEHKSQQQKISVYNPLDYKTYYCYVDKTRPQKINCSNFYGDKFDGYAEFDPNKKGQIHYKGNKTPKDVCILKLHDNRMDDTDVFVFFSEDLKSELGYVILSKNYKNCPNSDILARDYPKEGITGDRIVVRYLQNYYDYIYGGVGKLADKVEVKYCMENNIPPNIVSIADDDSHIAHYSRGKRFIEPDEDSEEYKFLTKTYGTSNPNEVLEKLLNDSKKSGQQVNLDEWNEYDFMMYLPKDLVEKYANEE